MEEERKSFALLIDSDNVSAKYIQGIMNELTSRHGQVTYRRIYGDWTSNQMGHWKNVLAEYSLTPMQQFANTKGKNATDSFLIIDAMDILYEGKVDGFCIVSSDSDFTRLASRLRDAGMTVVGMGEKKTPRSFRNACTVFTSLELVLEGDEAEESSSSAQGQDEGTTRREVAEAITGIINDVPGDTVSLGELGSRLVRIYPDFDVRTYGYSQLSKFLQSFPNLRVARNDTLLTVSLRDTEDLINEVDTFIVESVAGREKDGIALGILGGKIHDEFPDFNVKDFGYSKLSNFIRDLEGVVVKKVEGVTRVFPEDE